MNEQRDRLRELLQAADRVPPAPDCRDAVMAGIGERRTRLRLAWVYACAALLIFIGIGVGVGLRGPVAPRRHSVVVKAPPVHRPAQVQEQVAEEPPQSPTLVAVRQHNEPAQQPDRVVRKKTLVANMRHPKRDGREPEPAPIVPKPSVPDVVVQKPAPAGAQDKPVALVLVTFPSGETKPDTSYEYTDRNAETGEVTKCSVTRTGNQIDIHLETTPGEDKDPPVKGCVDYENKSSA
jgi:hypothetical protein